MLSMNEMMGNSPVNPEQRQKIDEEVKLTARQIIVGRKLFQRVTAPLGFGVQTHSFDLLTEISDALIEYMMSESEDMINVIRTDVKIPIVHKEFEIDRRDLASSKRTGTPLDVSNARSAAYKVAIAEDTLLIQGLSKDGSNYDIQGLYQAAGNDYSTSKAFSTAGNAIAAVGGGIALLMADNINPPYILALNPTQWGELMGLQTNGIAEVAQVEKQLGAGGSIISVPALSESDGMIVPVNNAPFYDLTIGLDMSTETEILQKSKNLFGRVFETLVPRIWDTNAICKLSDI